MREMNEKTGIFMKEFQVFGSSFDFYKNGFALFNGTNTIRIYKKSRKIKEILMSDEFNQSYPKFLCDSNLIGFNPSIKRVIISKLI
jgi:hypothetical protein